MCFNDFDKLNTEVLSVVAQYLTCIADAVKTGIEKFFVGDTELTLNPACFVCVTMNPG